MKKIVKRNGRDITYDVMDHSVYHKANKEVEENVKKGLRNNMIIKDSETGKKIDELIESVREKISTTKRDREIYNTDQWEKKFRIMKVGDLDGKILLLEWFEGRLNLIK